MGAVLEIALDLAPVAALLVLLLVAWLSTAALAARRHPTPHPVATGALPTTRSADHRVPGPRRGGHRAPVDGPAAKR